MRPGIARRVDHGADGAQPRLGRSGDARPRGVVVVERFLERAESQRLVVEQPGLVRVVVGFGVEPARERRRAARLQVPAAELVVVEQGEMPGGAQQVAQALDPLGRGLAAGADAPDGSVPSVRERLSW